jgi:putative Mn2+ efflux pump MntP
MPLKLLALVIPLSLDTFAVSAAIGMSGLDRRERLRLSLVLAAFEMAMPLLGFVVGAVIERRVGGTAEYLAIAVLAMVGLLMLRDRHDDDAADVRRARGWRLVGLGLSVSIDELAIGVAIGLVGLPVAVVILLIGAQAFIAAQVGSRLGAQLGNTIPDRAERLAGGMLLLVAAALLALRLIGHGA